MSSQFDREKTKKNIALVLERARSGENLEQLAEYRKLFKQGVPLFSRSWASAYLLMLLDRGNLGSQGYLGSKGYSGKIDSRPPRRGGGESRSRQKGQAAIPAERESKRRDESSRAEPQRYPLADEESKILFVSVGRNRRVFPREILGIINSKTAIPKEDIGAIRILDNYSFVQVRDTVADRIIEALNGMNFRGRTLAVNYAKPRRDGEDGEDEQELSEPFEETGDAAAAAESMENEELSAETESEYGDSSPDETDITDTSGANSDTEEER